MTTQQQIAVAILFAILLCAAVYYVDRRYIIDPMVRNAEGYVKYYDNQKDGN